MPEAVFDYVMQVLLIAAIPGCFLFTLAASRMFLWPTLRTLFAVSGTSVHGALILVSTSWFLGLGLRGLIGIWGFYFDIPITTVIIVVGVVGILGWVLGFVYLGQAMVHSNFGDFFRLYTARITRLEMVVLSVIFLQILIFIYMATAPWVNWDALVLYGNYSRYVADGWVHADFVDHGFLSSGAKFAQISTAQEIYAVGDTYLAKGLRVANLVFCSMGFYGLSRWLGISRTWSLLGIAALLGTPDLIWLATSLKVDALTMVLELSAAILLTVALVSFLPQHRNNIHQRSMLLIFSVALASLAFSTRFSGVYFLGLVSVLAAVLIVHDKGPVRSQALGIFALVSAVALGGIGYLVNIVEIGNPLYPFAASWPFQDGLHEITFDGWRDQYNISGFPPVIEQLYLLFHLALGIEGWTWRFGITSLPHANHHAVSMVWLTPAMMSIFLVPFFRRLAPATMIVVAIFILWFIAWSLGLHFSRVFLAGSSITILIAGAIASLDSTSLSKFQRFLQIGVRYGLLLIVIGFVPFQIFKAANDYPGLKTLTGSEARYQSEVNAIRMGSNFQFSAGFPTLNEAREISTILESYPKAVVLADVPRAINILFDHGFFIEMETPTDDKSQIKFSPVADCILLNIGARGSDEILRSVRVEFPVLQFVTADDNWVLHCRST